MKNKQAKRNTVVRQRIGGRRFFIGIVIVVVSFILGWPVLFLTAAMGAIFGRFWFILGGIIYAISWIMLGIGTLIAGVDGVKYVKRRIRSKVFRSNRNDK